MLPRFLWRAVDWRKVHHFYSLEFEERGVSLWAFMRTWERDTFRRVVMAVTDSFAVDATRELSLLGSVVAAVGGLAYIIAVSGRSHVLAAPYGEYLGSGYSHKLVEYPVFDLRLLKRCPQKVSSSIFGPSDPFSMTEVFVTRLKGAEHRDWMMSRSSLRRLLSSSVTSWDCGLSLWSTSRRLVERLTATA